MKFRTWCCEDDERPLVTDISWAVSNFINAEGRNPTKIYVCKLETELFLNNHHNLEVIEDGSLSPRWFGLG